MRSSSGIRLPAFTMLPNEIIDDWMVDLSHAQLKVLLFMIRRTLGFGRRECSVSLKEMLNGLTAADGRVLHRGAGLSKKALLAAIGDLRDMGLIEAQRQQDETHGNLPTRYKLLLADDEETAPKTLPLVSPGPLPLVVPETTTPSSPADTYIRNKQERNKREEINTSPSASVDSPASNLQDAPEHAASNPAKKKSQAAKPPNRQAQVIDGIRDAGIEATLSGRDFGAIKSSTAPPALIVEAYVAAHTGRWRPSGVGDHLSVAWVCDRISAYVSWQNGANTPRNGTYHRAQTPEEAIENGGSYIVNGRVITERELVGNVHSEKF